MSVRKTASELQGDLWPLHAAAAKTKRERDSGSGPHCRPWCALCRVDTLAIREFYMVKNEVWDAAVGPDSFIDYSYLCIGCVHAQRVGFAGDRRPRIELMGPNPNDSAQQDHGQRRDRPDDELETPFIGLVQAAGSLRVGCAVPPGERQGRHDHGNHDDEHDRRRIDQEKSLRRRDRPLRIEDAGPLTGSERNGGAHHEPAKPARMTAWRSSAHPTGSALSRFRKSSCQISHHAPHRVRTESSATDWSWRGR